MENGELRIISTRDYSIYRLRIISTRDNSYL